MNKSLLGFAPSAECNRCHHVVSSESSVLPEKNEYFEVNSAINWTTSGESAQTLFSNRILVVDDDLVSRRFLEVALVRQGYVVVLAESAEAAQLQLSPSRIGSYFCVVTDHHMPGKTGVELMSWIKEKDPGLATILVTGEQEKNLIKESLRGGAFDFLEKPVNQASLRSAVAKAVEQTVKHRRMAESESAVKEIGVAQERMLGVDMKESPEKMDIFFYPMHEASGDFFSRFRPTPERLFCLLTDVSGHNLQAAFVSAYFQGLVRGFLARQAPVEDIFPDFNRFLLEEWNQSQTLFGTNAGIDTSVAACAILIDFEFQTAIVFTQGTPAPVFFSPDGSAHVIGKEGGVPLGWFKDVSAGKATQSIAGGGTFYLWTDGLEELAASRGVSSLSLACALQEARKRGHKFPWVECATDDILLSVIRVPSPYADEADFRPLLSEQYHGQQSADIDKLQAYWQRSLAVAVPELHGLPEVRLHDILLASREALLNALNHGCGGSAELTASFEIAYCVQHKTIRVRVSDPGVGHCFNVLEHEKLIGRELVERHRGLVLIKHLSSSMDLDHNGARITMDFKWP